MPLTNFADGRKPHSFFFLLFCKAGSKHKDIEPVEAKLRRRYLKYNFSTLHGVLGAVKKVGFKVSI